jgi:hypothetical protein
MTANIVFSCVRVRLSLRRLGKVIDFPRCDARAGFLAVKPDALRFPRKEKRGETAAMKHMVL